MGETNWKDELLELIERASTTAATGPRSRALSLTLTKLDEARLWLAEAPLEGDGAAASAGRSK